MQAAQRAPSPASYSKGVPQQAQAGSPKNVTASQQGGHRLPGSITIPPQARQWGGRMTSSNRRPAAFSPAASAPPPFDAVPSKAPFMPGERCVIQIR